MNYILIHGGNVSSNTWNAVLQRAIYPRNIKLGGRVWGDISIKLQEHSHAVYAPTLSNEYKHDLSCHVEQIYQIIKENNLKKIILVGHSYGGMIITKVANQYPRLIDHLVYLDAALPKHNQSLFDLLKLGGIDPGSVIQNKPKAYVEKINLNVNQVIKPINMHYISCSESEFSSITAIAKQVILDNQDECNFQVIKAGHLPMATDPGWLVHFLLGLSSFDYKY